MGWGGGVRGRREQRRRRSRERHWYARVTGRPAVGWLAGQCVTLAGGPAGHSAGRERSSARPPAARPPLRPLHSVPPLLSATAARRVDVERAGGPRNWFVAPGPHSDGSGGLSGPELSSFTQPLREGFSRALPTPQGRQHGGRSSLGSCVVTGDL